MHQLLSSCAAACVSAALGATPSAASAAQTSFPRLLNDTGSVTCYVPDRGGIEIPCEGTGQDGQYGRDVTDGRKFDGRGGFSYRKISSTGEPLPASATEWACVQDRITGLMWEMKTADGGLHDGLRTYTQLNDGDSDDADASFASSGTAPVPALMDLYLTDGSRSIPVAVVLDEDFRPVGWWGPRPRAVQAKVLAEKRAGVRPAADIYRDLRMWYARDAGESTIAEILEIMGRRRAG